MQCGKLHFNPAKNPAVLATATWDTVNARNIINAIEESFWRSLQNAIMANTSFPPANQYCTVYPGSSSHYQQRDFILTELSDKQQVFLEFDRGNAQPVLTEKIEEKSLNNGQQLGVYPTDATNIDIYSRVIHPQKGPKALGATPRLGIGVRMSAAVWPGIWQAMAHYNFAANAIQNSLRELNMLEDVLAGKPPHTNYLFSFGSIDEGHTGSTFEGLWTAGVLSALKSDTLPKYGADADHIMVKRGPEGLNRAKRIIDSARYYTFFTLDVSDILNYGAIKEPSSSKAEAYLTETLQDPEILKSVLAYHSQTEEGMLGRLVAKYWSALDAAQILYEYIRELKAGLPFDLELSIDENPPEVRTCESLTQDAELRFLIGEIQRRQLPITHIAPNFGVEKGVDYRCPGGLEELEARVRRQYRIASEQGIMLDCHSGDDLASATRQVFGRATEGHIHFKISPSLQVIFGETLEDLYPDQFRFWWDDTLAYARREAEGGASVAIESLQAYQNAPQSQSLARTSLFQHFNFATVGKRDTQGQFIFRDKFYDLPAAFYEEYTRRIEQQLGEVAQDIFQR